MIQGNQNQMNKAVFALILRTLEDLEPTQDSEKEEESQKEENLGTDFGKGYSFIEI
jgi:hypothetical protein